MEICYNLNLKLQVLEQNNSVNDRRPRMKTGENLIKFVYSPQKDEFNCYIRLIFLIEIGGFHNYINKFYIVLI